MIRFYNGRVLQFDGGVRVSEDREVWVDGNSICYVGPAREDMPSFDRQIDLKGDLLMPSFKNAHTHTAMTFLRSLADDLPLQEWLTQQVFPREARLTPEMIYEFTRIGILEYLSSGITASFDMYFKNDAYTKANIDSGFRTVICASMNNFDPDPTYVEQEYRKFNDLHELISYRLGIHAEYTTSRERMEYISSLVHKYEAPFFCHNSETRGEVEGCLERYGMTPTELFDDLGLLDYGGGGYHCVYFSDHDIEIFKKRGCWVVTNPSSNVKLASGIAPVSRYLDEGLNLAIGTDGAASNNALDMFREMYLTAVLQKVANMDAASCDPLKVLEMACVGGARAMGLDDCDDIAEGKKADLIVLDLTRPNMQPIHNIPKNIVYAGSKENVRLTMVNGVVRYEDGVFHIGETPEVIYRNAQSMIKEVL